MSQSPEGFRRLTGVKRTTFTVMTKILKEAQVQLKAQGGKPNKLSIEDMLLMALEYLREYRTYFHIS
ncbi:transposase family protein, partial [Allofrancisella guangzhouensis]|uniref:transposase family protein n=1 Tax=Allofrancisella guangzhouensis TaxID=594679 RepID=UPI0019039BFB